MSSKLNGSAERFTAALRDLVSEAASEAIAPVEERLNARIDGMAIDIQEVEERLANRIDRGIEKIEVQIQQGRVS